MSERRANASLEHQFEGGLPHSEIHGSKGARPSPQLIAACHVLHRLSSPRHPSNALCYLRFLSAMHGGDDASHPHGYLLDCIPSCPETAVGAAGEPSSTMSMKSPPANANVETVYASRSPPMRTLVRKPGGARRDRTDDLMLAKHALSQLSYGP